MNMCTTTGPNKYKMLCAGANWNACLFYKWLIAVSLERHNSRKRGTFNSLIYNNVFQVWQQPQKTNPGKGPRSWQYHNWNNQGIMPVMPRHVLPLLSTMLQTFWKHNKKHPPTQKDDPQLLSNYRPITPANTIQSVYEHPNISPTKLWWKTWASTFQPRSNQITTKYHKTNPSDPRHPRRHQINKQRHTSNMYGLWNAFGFIDHTWLLALMEDLGCPQDVVEPEKDIYVNSTPSIFGSHFETTPPIQISRGTIQGDNSQPLLFIMLLESSYDS